MTDQAISIPDARPRTQQRSAPPGAIATQCNVLHAIILHDMKTRFFGNVWGYLATIIWPGIHLAVLIAIHALHLSDMYGDSVVLFAATGVLPFIAWNYIARNSIMGQTSNRALLNYPIITPLDLLVSRAFLEIVTIFIVFVGLNAVMLLFDIDIVPRDLDQAALGFLSAILLGIGFGFLFGVIAPWFPFISFLWMFFMIMAHIFSGIAVPVESMPQQIQTFASYNPLLHSVEWVRSAYWNDYPTHLLDKSYVYLFGGVVTVLGLALERVLRKNRRIKH